MAGGFIKGALSGYGMADKAKKDKEDRDYKRAKMKAAPAMKRGGKVTKPKGRCK